MNEPSENRISMQPSGMNPGNEQLIKKIRSRIQSEGRITFAEFMDMSLYDPEYGYYTSGRDTEGTQGDFLTSVSMSPAFGSAIAEWIAAIMDEMDNPSRFEIVEMGAGKGLLCAGILYHLKDAYPDAYDTVLYRIIEAPNAQSNLSPFGHPLSEDFPGKIQVDNSLNDLVNISVTGCFISNELMDALPVHMVTVKDSELAEIYVTLDGNKFAEITGPLSDSAITKYFEKIDIALPEDYRTEINLKMVNLIQEIAIKLSAGYVLTIDYGYMADDYYSPAHSRGTLMCYHRHTLCEDPYVRVGEQDITTHVDFTGLMVSGEYSGLDTVDLISQRSFLISNGIQEWLNKRKNNQSDRRAVSALIDPAGLGEFKVLISKKST